MTLWPIKITNDTMTQTVSRLKKKQRIPSYFVYSSWIPQNPHRKKIHKLPPKSHPTKTPKNIPLVDTL